jgi:hypothetical protein
VARRFLPMTACVAFVSALPATTYADPPPTVTGREAVERFAANVRSFPHYTCKYTVTRAEAYTFDDARAGKWVNAVSIDCVLRVDGEYEAWTGRVPPRPPSDAPPAKPGQWGAAGLLHLYDFDYIGNGRIGFTNGMGMSGAWNFLSSKSWFEVVQVPLRAGHGRKFGALGAPDVLLADPNFEFADLGTTEADSRRLVRVRFTYNYDINGRQGQDVREYHLDSSRGYLPGYQAMPGGSVKTLDGRPLDQTFLVDASDCGKGRWFPTRVLSVRAMIPPGVAHLVSELRVTDLDLARPPEDELAVRLPGGSLVIHNGNPKKRFQVSSAQTIRARQLPELEADLDATVPPPGMWEQLLAPFGSWRWPAVGLGAILLVGALVVVWRWRRKPAVASATAHDAVK